MLLHGFASKDCTRDTPHIPHIASCSHHSSRPTHSPQFYYQSPKVCFKWSLPYFASLYSTHEWDHPTFFLLLLTCFGWWGLKGNCGPHPSVLRVYTEITSDRLGKPSVCRVSKPSQPCARRVPNSLYSLQPALDSFCLTWLPTAPPKL